MASVFPISDSIEDATLVNPLSPDQAALFFELLQRITSRVMERCMIRSGHYQGLFWHGAVRSQRQALALLEAAGIFRADEGAMLALNPPEHEIAGRLQAYSGQIDRSHLDTVVEIFVDLFSEFPDEQNPEIPITHRPFEVPTVYSQTFEMLAATGFACRTPEGWIWTDLMIPAMIRIGLWSPEGACYHDQSDNA